MKKKFFLIVLSIVLAIFFSRISLNFLGHYFGLNFNFERFTPYFPGMDHLDTYQMFSPENKNFKKILLLGASATDSVGCDASWTKADPTRTPPQNAHYTCKIDWFMNQELSNKSIKNWKTFNLASSGAALNNLLYIYSAISNLKPEIVIIAIAGYFFIDKDTAKLNGGKLEAQKWAQLDKFLNDQGDEIVNLWKESKKIIKQEGVDVDQTIADNDIQVNLNFPIDNFYNNNSNKKYQLIDALAYYIANLRQFHISEGPLLPVKIYPWYTSERVPKGNCCPDTPEQDFRLVSIYKIMDLLQKKHGGKLIIYQLPKWTVRNDQTYRRYFSIPLKQKLDSLGIRLWDLVDLPLEIQTEIYDSGHATLYGNKKIGAEMIRLLEADGLLQN